jgi:ABC-2 type transport system permease protein
VRIWSVVEVISGLIVLIVGITRVQSSLGGLETLAFLAAISLGAVMLYCFWLVITTGAFWIVRMDHVLELFEGIYATGRFPVGIYPSWLRYGVTFLVPVGFAVTVPAQALTGRLHGLTLLGAAGFAVALFAFTRWFWRFGLRRYSGASA